MRRLYGVLRADSPFTTPLLTRISQYAHRTLKTWTAGTAILRRSYSESDLRRGYMTTDIDRGLVPPTFLRRFMLAGTALTGVVAAVALAAIILTALFGGEGSQPLPSRSSPEAWH